MRFPALLFVFLIAGSLVADPGTGEMWGAAFGKGDGTLESRTFRVIRAATPGGFSVETFLPAEGSPVSKVRVDLDDSGNLVRSRTDYFDRQLAQWYRADYLLTEVQPKVRNLAFQRVLANQVQEAKNLTWGPDFIEFSTLPFYLEKRISRGDLTTFRFTTYYADLQGRMEVTIRSTGTPLDVDRRYSYPRALRDRFGRRTVVLASLNAVGDFRGGYPFPFYYAFSPGTPLRWAAAWGGNPKAPSFQWKE